MSAALAQTAAAIDLAETLLDDAKLDSYIADLRKENLQGDLSPANEKHRKEIRSRAYAVARAKTALDEAGKTLGEEYRVKLDGVNKRRRTAKEKLEALQDEILLPVTQWENQESARIESVKATIARIDMLAMVSLDNTSAEVAQRITELRKIEIEHSAFQDFWDATLAKRDTAVERLTAALERLTKQEADKAELDKLRADADARAAEDARRVAAEEAAAKKAHDEKVAADAKAERERIEAERQEQARAQALQAATIAAEEAKAEAERRALAALEAEKAQAAEALAEKERQHQAEIARLQRERDEKDAAERQEREAALAREQAQRDEDARRQSDEEHRQKVMDEAGQAIEQIMLVSTATAAVLVRAIIAGQVPHCRIEF